MKGTGISTDVPAAGSETGGYQEWLLRYRRMLIIATHLVLFVGSLFLAFLFAFNMHLGRSWFMYPFPALLAVVLPVKLILFGRFGLYRGWWRYVGISDLLQIAKASIASAILIMLVWTLYGTFGSRLVPDSVGAEVDRRIEQLQQEREQVVTQVEAYEYARRIENLRSLDKLIDLSRIPQMKRQVPALSQAEAEELQARIETLHAFWLQIHGVIMLDLLTTIMLFGGLRMMIRLYHEEFFAQPTDGLKRLLIVGAGNAGEALLRELTRTRAHQFHAVGFVDDDPAKRGMAIHGITVLGGVDEIPAIAEKYSVDEIAIAIPSATRKQLRHVVQVCQGTQLRFQTVPSITDIASGKLRVSQIRDVDINDLLGRDAVELDLETIRGFLRGKVLLVTGAGGSIGSEMCRQVCNFGPAKLVLIEQAENPLFDIERELRKDYPEVPLVAVVRNITDRERIEQVFEQYRPEVVIHAAAHKHVPLMEINPGEAIKNNVFGTKVMADASDRYGVENFVMISTDKAVNPTSIMGSSKRIAEMYIQDLNSTSATHFVTVRFGNVLGSNGSVVPIFKKQIAAGGPVTVTHPEMQRYFMTIPEASQLVLQAATMGEGGEIFVLDMGEPVKIVHLARELITLSGFRPGEDIEIVFTGMRPGEKLFEELSIEGEDMQPTRHPKIGIWKNIPKDRETLRSTIETLLKVSPTQNYVEIVRLVKQLIPEYIGDKAQMDSAVPSQQTSPRSA